MNAERGALEAATVRQQCKPLRMPTIGAQCTQLTEQAALDEVGYVPLAEDGAEFLFQVIGTGREAAVIITTNLPFSEWATVIPNARLCKALIDRITERANIIEIGTESYWFGRTLEKRKTKYADIKT